MNPTDPYETGFPKKGTYEKIPHRDSVGNLGFRHLSLLRAASERIPSEMGIGPCFDKHYMDILGVRALNDLEVYEFDE